MLEVEGGQRLAREPFRVQLEPRSGLGQIAIVGVLAAQAGHDRQPGGDGGGKRDSIDRLAARHGQDERQPRRTGCPARIGARTGQRDWWGASARELDAARLRRVAGPAGQTGRRNCFSRRYRTAPAGSLLVPRSRPYSISVRLAMTGAP